MNPTHEKIEFAIEDLENLIEGIQNGIPVKIENLQHIIDCLEG